MEQLYYEYKRILEEKLTALGFTTQPENTAGLGRSITFEKDNFQVSLVFDLRDQMLFLQARKDGKSAGNASFSNTGNSETNFYTKLNSILDKQGMKIEVPAPPAKSGGFLSKLFGKK